MLINQELDQQARRLVTLEREQQLRSLPTAVQHVFNGPKQLDAVNPAARLRLKRVILPLALPHTTGQREFSSGPTIQLGAVIIAARLRLRRVTLALAVLYTAEQRDIFQQSEHTARCRGNSRSTVTQARAFSAGTAIHGRTA